MVGNYLYVAPGESTDHVYGVQTSEPRRCWSTQPYSLSALVLLLGPVLLNTRRCKELLSMLKAKYGPPTVTEEFWEERAWNRRLAWRRAGEALVLQCFRLKGRNFSPKHSLSIELRSGSYR
jgi:hypothetical protein